MRYRALSAALLLVGCGYVDSETVQALTNLSPLEVDPGQYRVVVNLPEGLDIQQSGARLTVAAQRPDTHATSSQTYVLERSDQGKGQSAYQIAASDLPTLRAQQALIREWETETNGATEGRFGVDVDGCRTGAGPDLDALMSVTLISGEDGTSRALAPPTPVRDVLLTGGDNELILAACR